MMEEVDEGDLSSILRVVLYLKSEKEKGNERLQLFSVPDIAAAVVSFTKSVSAPEIITGRLEELLLNKKDMFTCDRDRKYFGLKMQSGERQFSEFERGLLTGAVGCQGRTIQHSSGSSSSSESARASTKHPRETTAESEWSEQPKAKKRRTADVSSSASSQSGQRDGGDLDGASSAMVLHSWSWSCFHGLQQACRAVRPEDAQDHSDPRLASCREQSHRHSRTCDLQMRMWKTRRC
jgi:hypothetical protein